jgi:hypothetical protein
MLIYLLFYALASRETLRSPQFFLKRQLHEIFDLLYFQKSIVPRPLSYTRKYIRILFRIRGDIREYVLCYIVQSHLYTMLHCVES